MEGNLHISYQFFENERLLVQKFSGLFSFELYSKYTNYLMSNIELDSVSKVIIDFRALTIGKNLKELKQEIKRIAELRRTIQQKTIKKTNVLQLFLVDKPIPTAVAKIFVNYFPQLDYHICSTLHSAIVHLNLNITENKLEHMIENLTNEFIATLFEDTNLQNTP